MPKVFTSETQKVGEIGETVAVKFLVKQGFSIIDRNYTKKWGEIDIIAEKGGKMYFIEVKSVCRNNLGDVNPADAKALAGKHENVTHVTDEYRPEENMHPWKLKRLARTIQIYLLSNRIPEEKEWQIDLLVVFLDLKAKKGKVKVVSNIIL